MSIGTAILALTPGLYWPLSDAGSVASDITGNGRNGNYAGAPQHQVPGVETGTYAVSYPAAQAGAVTRGNTFLGTTAFSIVIYAAMASLNGPNNADLADNGLGEAKGWSLVLSGAGAYGANSRSSVIRQAIATNAFGVDIAPDAFWHQYALVFNGATSWTLYRDAVALATITPGTYNAVTAAGAVAMGAPNPGFYAHFAYWASALTQPQLAGIIAAETDRTNPPWVTGQGVVNPVLFTDLAALQATVNSILAAVRSTYS
jgi:hypothetical protein